MFHGPGPGRPKGSKNKTTLELAQRMREFVEDPAAVEKMRQQYQSGRLHPMLVQMFHQYAYGKPKDTVTVEGVSPAVFTLQVLKGQDSTHE